MDCYVCFYVAFDNSFCKRYNKILSIYAWNKEEKIKHLLKKPAIGGLYFLFHSNIYLFLHFSHSDGKAEVYHEIDDSRRSEKDENILRGDGVSGKSVCGGHKLFHNKHQLRNANLRKIGSILDDGDGLAGKGRDDSAESLGQDDINHNLHEAETLASAGFKLSFRNCIKSAADYFGDYCRIENYSCNQCS